jgi:glutathione S-transferase
MEGFKLYGFGARAHKVLAAANWAGVPIETLPFNMGVTNKTPEYLATCPTGKVRAELPFRVNLPMYLTM